MAYCTELNGNIEKITELIKNPETQDHNISRLPGSVVQLLFFLHLILIVRSRFP